MAHYTTHHTTMPPKQKLNEKNKAAKRQERASDKTFGLKNKNKSAKVQRFVQQVEATASGADKKKQAEKERKEAEKKAAAAAKAEAEKLFGSVVITQKVPFGVDPKTVLCAYFKEGQCTKGTRCKFSHNLEADRKVQKKDLYTDAREGEKEQDMDTWDEEELRKVILSKHGNPKTTTDIVCKHFLDAIEDSKYGWFWVCPSGGDQCKYRHSLPPGFVFKTKEQKKLEKLALEKQPKITLEDFLETERAKLPKNLTPVTLETFNKWKADRVKAKEDAAAEEARKLTQKQMSGRQLLLTGKYDDDEEDDGTNGTAWDLSEFKPSLDIVDEE